MEKRDLTNMDTAGSGVSDNVHDFKSFGDPDAWKLICKGASPQQGWMHSTKALEIEGMGCLVQVLSVQMSEDSSQNYRPAVATSVVFVPDVAIVEQTMLSETGGAPEVFARKIVPIFVAKLAHDEQQAAIEDTKALMAETIGTVGQKVAEIGPENKQLSEVPDVAPEYENYGEEQQVDNVVECGEPQEKEYKA